MQALIGFSCSIEAFYFVTIVNIRSIFDKIAVLNQMISSLSVVKCDRGQLVCGGQQLQAVWSPEKTTMH
jgi:hypothetical protein